MTPSQAAAGTVRAPVRPASGLGDPGPSFAQGDGRPDGGVEAVDHDRRAPWTPSRPGTAAPLGPSVPFLAQQIAQGALEAPVWGDAGPVFGALPVPGRVTMEDQTPEGPETGNRRYEDALRQPGIRQDSYLGVYEATAAMAESFVLSRYGAHLDRDGVFVLQAQPIDVTS
jgi:hypothetical protein